MAGTDQMKPLAHAVDRSSSDEEDPRWHSAKKLSRKQSFFICCSATTVAIFVIVIVTLIYTVFKIKKPEIAMNSVRIDRMKLNFGGGGGGVPLTLNLTLIADVSVKNPNFATFRFHNSTTLLFYRGKTVGEAHTPAGKALARRTLRMNVTIDVVGDQLVSVTNLLTSDVASGALTVNSYTSIGGRVKFLILINRHVDVVMNCTVIVSVSDQTIQNQACNNEKLKINKMQASDEGNKALKKSTRCKHPTRGTKPSQS